MKETIKSLGILFYYIVCQVIATIIIIFVKAYTDFDWLVKINSYIQSNDIFSKEYFSLMWVILYPALIAADIIIIIPFLIKAKKEKEKLFKRISIKEFNFFVNLAIVLNFIISFLVNLIPDTFSSSYNQLMNLVISDNFIMTFITTGLLAPIIEEFVFRYAIIKIFSKKGIKYAIIISALIFGIAHLNPIQSTYAFILGLLLGYLYYKNNNLLIPIIIHLIINSTSVLYEYAPQTIKNIMLIFVFISFIMLILSFKKIIDKKHKI